MEFTQLTTAQGGECLIHDIVFDYYGRRFATCSTDGKIRVWDEEDGDGRASDGGSTANGGWQYAEIQEAHSGQIWRLSWAHPVFGKDTCI
jgi:nucleoporin SEH1